VIRPVLEAVARTVRPAVRLVSPLPPHAPEPYPDEPFAPVYDYVPLHGIEGMLPDSLAPHDCDPLVFGPPGSGELQRTWNRMAPL
jgi:hypothetical protein